MRIHRPAASAVAFALAALLSSQPLGAQGFTELKVYNDAGDLCGSPAISFTGATLYMSCSTLMGDGISRASATNGDLRSFINMAGSQYAHGNFAMIATASYRDILQLVPVGDPTTAAWVRLNAEVRGTIHGHVEADINNDVLVQGEATLNYDGNNPATDCQFQGEAGGYYHPADFAQFVDCSFSELVPFAPNIATSLQLYYHTNYFARTPDPYTFVTADFEHTGFLSSITVYDAAMQDVTADYTQTFANGSVVGDPDLVVSATPEPGSLLLLATGLSIIGIAVKPSRDPRNRPRSV